MRKYGFYLLVLAVLSFILPVIGLRVKVLTGNPLLTILAVIIGIVLIAADIKDEK